MTRIKKKSKPKRGVFLPDCWAVRDSDGEIEGIIIDGFDPRLLDEDDDCSFAHADHFDESVRGLRQRRLALCKFYPHWTKNVENGLLVRRSTGEVIGLWVSYCMIDVTAFRHTDYVIQWVPFNQAVSALRAAKARLDVYDNASNGAEKPPFPGYDRDARQAAFGVEGVFNVKNEFMGFWDSRFEKPLDWLQLSAKSLKFFDETNLNRVGGLAAQTRIDLLRLPGFDTKMLLEVENALEAVDLQLGVEIWGYQDVVCRAKKG